MRGRMSLLYLRLVLLPRGDKLALLAGATLIGLMGLLAVTGAPWIGRFALAWANRGFGPTWRCSWIARSEPVCVKALTEPRKALPPAH